MHANARQRFNASFTPERYGSFLRALEAEWSFPISFRVAETPVFIPSAHRDTLLRAGGEVLEFLSRPDLLDVTRPALHPQTFVPGDEGRPTTLCVDFAATLGPDGEFLPQLIEFQGFPTVFAYKLGLQRLYRHFFDVPENFSPFLGGLDEAAFAERLGRLLLGDHRPENVVLLEIEPLKQNTAVDFLATQKLFGIEPVCLSEIVREGRQLFYRRGGRNIPIHRLYNRVIFDELLQRSDLPRQFNLTEEVDVEWVCHPNWYGRISKFCMPMLHGRYVPESRLLSDFDRFPEDLEAFVLKPLYSFSGTGVRFHVRPEDLEAVPENDRGNWMLQRKVDYAPMVRAADEGSVKVEIRMIYFWEDGRPRPEPVFNICRLSRGEMIGVKYNANKTFVGGTIGFFEN
jgi:hypothetical protein